MLGRIGFTRRSIVSVRSLTRSMSVSSVRRVIYKDKDILIEEPKLDTKSGFISRNIKYFNDVDKAFNSVKKIPTKTKSEVLLSGIEKYPELLFYLACFHKCLKSIGIDQSDNNRDKLWRYRFKYFTELKQLHTSFFSNCKFLAVTQHDHRLGFNPQNIGILDPKNFTKEQYEELQTGSYKGADYTEIMFLNRTPFEKKDI